MTKLRRLWDRGARKFTVAPDQADLFAKLKFPCC